MATRVGQYSCTRWTTVQVHHTVHHNMEMLAKIGKADSGLAANQGRVVFVNTAQRARINFFMRRSKTGTYYTGVRHLRPGCAYICMCNLEDIVDVQFTVYTEPMPGWDYTLDNYQVDFEGNCAAIVSLYAANCTPRADATISDTLTLQELCVRQVPRAFVRQIQSEPELCTRFRHTNVIVESTDTGNRRYTCSRPDVHGRYLNYNYSPPQEASL